MLGALLSDTSRNWTLSEILEATKWTDQVHVAGAAGAKRGGLVEITESSFAQLHLVQKDLTLQKMVC